MDYNVCKILMSTGKKIYGKLKVVFEYTMYSDTIKLSIIQILVQKKSKMRGRIAFET